MTQVKPDELVTARRGLHPGATISLEGMVERYRQVCTLEHNEAFFAKKIVIVEGPTEQAAIPVFATALGLDFDVGGVSIVAADGKTNIDQLYQLYVSFGLPTFVIFDGDHGSTDLEKARWNRTLLRMLDVAELEEPEQAVTSTFAVFRVRFEVALEGAVEAASPGLYGQLRQAALTQLGASAGKGLLARFIANELVIARGARPPIIPDFIRAIIASVASLGEPIIPEDASPAADEPLF